MAEPGGKSRAVSLAPGTTEVHAAEYATRY
jgi:hypothetical protein